MSERVDQLIAGYLDGDLAAGDASELEQLLAADADARRHFIALCRIERQIAAEVAPIAIDASVRAELREDSERDTEAVMREARTKAQRPSWRGQAAHHHPPRRARWWWLMAVAAAVVLAVLPLAPRSAPTSVESIVPVATIDRTTNGVRVTRDGQVLETYVGMALTVRDFIQVPAGPADGQEAGRGDLAPVAPSLPFALAFADGTHLALKPESSLQLPPSPERKQLRLISGGLQASVVPQPPGASMLIATPQAVAEIVGTELTLVATADATRLETSHGAVRLTRVSDGATTLVSTGEYALAASNGELRAQPVRPPAPAVSGSAEVVLRYDLEDGRRPEELDSGVVVAGPARAGNRFCIQGEEKPHLYGGLPFKQEVWIEREREILFTCTAGMFLSFDCWLISGANGDGRLDAGIYDESKRSGMSLQLPSIAPGQWTRIRVPLDDFHRDDGGAVGIEAGDQLKTLIIAAPGRGGQLYVDNLEITRR